MKKEKQKLSLDQQAVYEIKVPGQIDESWLQLTGVREIYVEKDNDDPTITILTCTADQAALIGVLRNLYSIGLPIISVICIEIN